MDRKVITLYQGNKQIVGLGQINLNYDYKMIISELSHLKPEK